jgi:hypothetical protein
MTTVRSLLINDTHKWAVGAGVCSEADIIIPAMEDLQNVPDEKIGKMVKALILHARLLYAESICELLSMCGSTYHLEESHIEKYQEILRPFLGHEEIDTWYAVLCDEKVRRENKRIRQERKKKRAVGCVYVIKHQGTYKIGRSRHPARRIEQEISPKLPHEVETVHIIETNDMYSLELELHNKYADKRLNGEWFELDEGDIAWLQTL